MKCDFSYKHYTEIIELFFKKGYKFKGFNEECGDEKTVYFRHDLEITIEKAHKLACFESAIGVSATYCVRFVSPFYNIFSSDNLRMLREIADMGHTLALHYDMIPNRDIEDNYRQAKIQYNTLRDYIEIEKIVSIHRPKKEILGKPFKGFVHTYDNQFFNDARYLSDSEGKWRDECPCKWLTGKAGLLSDRFQILTHPTWWGDRIKDPCKHIHKFLENKIYQLDELMYNDNPFYKHKLNLCKKITKK